MPRVRSAVLDDLDAFVDLAREVEPLFGPMVDDQDFHAGIRKAMESNALLCAVDDADHLEGAIAVDFATNTIVWLAVSSKSRGEGMGGALLRHALEKLDAKRPVSVTTFAKGAPEAEPARRLYERNGFREVASVGSNPAGYATVLMKRNLF